MIRVVNVIMIKVGGVMIKMFFRIMRQIVFLYREVGFKVFDLGKEVVKQIVDLVVDN